MSTKNEIKVICSSKEEIEQLISDCGLTDYVNSSGKFMAPFVAFCDEDTPVVMEDSPADSEYNLKLFYVNGPAGKYSVVVGELSPLYIICESGSLAVSYPYRKNVTNVNCNARNYKEVTITDLNGDACVSTVLTLLNKN